MTIDTHLFVDIIQNEGVTYLYFDQVGDDRIEYYHGITGSKVGICLSDDFISKFVAEQMLRQLGLSDLIDRIPFN